MEHRFPLTLVAYTIFLVVVIALAYLGNIAFSHQVHDVPRLRVVAHSDSPYDQWVKSEVAHLALQWWGKTTAKGVSLPLFSQQGGDGTEEALGGLRDAIYAWLGEHDVSYDFRIDVGQIAQPPRVFEGHFVAAGKAPAILITLGEGRGHNFWTLLFPQLSPKGAFFQEHKVQEIEDPGDSERDRANSSLPATSDRMEQLSLSGGAFSSSSSHSSRSGDVGRTQEGNEGKFVWRVYVWDFLHDVWERAFSR